MSQNGRIEEEKRLLHRSASPQPFLSQRSLENGNVGRENARINTHTSVRTVERINVCTCFNPQSAPH